MYGPTETPQRPKHALLTGKENWATWSKAFNIYLITKNNEDIISDNPIPLNPSALIGEIGNDHIKEYILDTEEIEEDKITSQKIAANKKKVIKALQAKYDEWKKRNNETLGEIFYGCSTSIQSLIGNYRIAKEL
ncbi:hypothetical protein GJ744_008855 [Endocarpon pusillum]|nr:hypothetical protein GJ744_008855 [Endocarpon pusillum]